MPITPLEIETVLNLLAATPQRLAALSAGVENTRLHTNGGEEAWSSNDILAHLRACTDVWTKSMDAMLSQDHPTLRYVSPRTWIHKTNYREQPFHASLQIFIAQRAALLEKLQPLSLESWARGATFTGTTQGKNHNVYTYAKRMALHENGHCEQIQELLTHLS
jgi:hypothetical protein